jgi:hypothetical protein
MSLSKPPSRSAARSFLIIPCSVGTVCAADALRVTKAVSRLGHIAVLFPSPSEGTKYDAYSIVRVAEALNTEIDHASRITLVVVGFPKDGLAMHFPDLVQSVRNRPDGVAVRVVHSKMNAAEAIGPFRAAYDAVVSASDIRNQTNNDVDVEAVRRLIVDLPPRG